MAAYFVRTLRSNNQLRYSAARAFSTKLQGQSCLLCGSRWNSGPLNFNAPRSSDFPRLSTASTRLSSSSQVPETTGRVEETEELDELYEQIVLEVKGHDPAVLNSYEKFVTLAAGELEINVSRVFTPPRVITRWTQLKSVHIFKKHRVQYESRTHYRVFELQQLTGSTADTFLEYVQRCLPEGMAMKVTKHRLEVLPEHLKPPTKSPAPDSAEKS